MNTQSKKDRGGWSGGPVPEWTPADRRFVAGVVVVAVVAVVGFGLVFAAALGYV